MSLILGILDLQWGSHTPVLVNMVVTLLVAEKYPGELKESGNEKKDLKQLQKLAVKALS